MTKHYKKFIVYPEQANEWLSRYESGEALKAIAHNDQYDIRTVKRQVQEAASERSMKETRQAVLRSALEKHFQDLVNLAEKIRCAVTIWAPITLDQDAVYLLDGLRQHLPRSPLWLYLDKYQAKFGKLTDAYQTQSPELTKKLNTLLFNEKKANILDFKIHAEPAEDIIAVEAKTGISEDANQVLIYDKTVSQYVQSRRLFEENEETKRLQYKLVDELTTIVLRRVVPGRCRYCPL